MDLFSKLHAWTGSILCAMMLISSANGQTVSISVSNEPIEKVFLLVEKQTGYNFIYSAEAIAGAKTVTLTVKQEPLDNFLKIFFRDQPLSYRIDKKHIILKMAVAQPANSAKRELHGIIISKKEEPVAGATVSIKSLGLFSVSDIHGKFYFPRVPDHVILFVSGAEIEPKEIGISTLSFVTIPVTAKVGTLDETIVIAYGKTTRRSTTGAESHVTREQIDRQPVSNIQAALSGRITGLQVTQSSGLPGTHFTVRLRGQNSIANGNEPLYIIDGVPFPSVSLTSNFGGGGGMIASPLNNLNLSDIESVTVLKDADATAIYGSRGANGVILITTRKGKAGQTKADAKIYAGLGKVSRLMKMLKTKDYLEMRREAFANDGVSSIPGSARDLFLWDTTRYTDWQKELIGGTMHIADINAGVSGGSDLTQFRFNTGYHKETTVLPGNFGEEKFSAKLNVQHSSSDKKFSLAVSASFLRNKNNLPLNDVTANFTLAPNAPALYTQDGKLNWENGSWTNPYSLFLKTYKTVTDHLEGNLTANYQLLKDLNIIINFGYSSIEMKENLVMPKSAFNPALPIAASAGFANNYVHTFITEPRLQYKINKGKAGLQLTVGSTFQSTDQKAFSQTGNGYLSDELLQSLMGAASVITNRDIQSRYRYAGYFAKANFDVDKKYYVTLTARRDGSSRYGPANRFNNFGSAGAGWIISQERFFESVNAISYAKLRASVGVTGNDQIGDYKYLDTYSPGSYSYLGMTTLFPMQLFNPGYSWEKVIKREFGFDLGLFKDILLFNAGFYHNLTTNQLISYALPTVTGFNGILRNIPARILNQGWELEINAKLVQTKNWKWESHFQISIPRNKLLSFEGLANSTYANSYIIGKSIFIARKLTYGGIDPATGNYSFDDVDKDGKISTPNDLGSVLFTGQQYFGSLENSVAYKRFTLSFLFQFVRQEFSPNYLIRYPKPGVQSNQPNFVMDRWESAGDNAAFQKFSSSNSANNTAFNNFRNSDAAYSDASYIRLKNLYFSYQPPETLLRKAKIADCIFFLQTQNLFIITNYKGLDPETKLVVPPLRVFTAGVQLTF